MPSQATLLEEIEKHKNKLAATKPKFPMFINYPTYMDDLAQHIGCLPTPHRHLYQGRVRAISFSPPSHLCGALSTLTPLRIPQVKQILDDGPLLPITYRLHGDGHWPNAAPTLARL